MYFNKKKGNEFCENKLVPLAAGLIVGEAIIGMGYAAFEVLSK